MKQSSLKEMERLMRRLERMSPQEKAEYYEHKRKWAREYARKRRQDPAFRKKELEQQKKYRSRPEVREMRRQKDIIYNKTKRKYLPLTDEQKKTKAKNRRISYERQQKARKIINLPRYRTYFGFQFTFYAKKDGIAYSLNSFCKNNKRITYMGQKPSVYGRFETYEDCLKDCFRWVVGTKHTIKIDNKIFVIYPDLYYEVYCKGLLVETSKTFKSYNACWNHIKREYV